MNCSAKTGTARARVARLLLRLAGPDASTPFRLLGREDIGAMLGLTPETAYTPVRPEVRRQQLARLGFDSPVPSTASPIGSGLPRAA